MRSFKAIFFERGLGVSQARTIQLTISKLSYDTWNDIYGIVNDSGSEVIDGCFDGPDTAKLMLAKFSGSPIDEIDLSELYGNLTVCGCAVVE